MFGETEVHVGEVDEDGDVGPLLFQAGDQLAILAEDEGRVPEHLGDAHVRDVLGTDGLELAGGGHLRAAQSSEGSRGELCAEGGDEGCAVGVAGGLAGREEEARVGRRGDGFSLAAVV